LTFNSDGTYTFDASSYDSLAAGQTQVLSIPFTATDGIATSAPVNLVITITGNNDVPVAVASSNTVNEDATITGSVSATDADTGAVLSYALVNPAPMGLTFNSDGTYTFDVSSYDSLAVGQTQVLDIAFTATDGIATSTAENLTITITGTNDVPVAVASSNTVLEDAVIRGSVSATDADTGAVLSYALVNPAPTGLTFNNNGTFTFDASSYDSLAAGQTQVLDIADLNGCKFNHHHHRYQRRSNHHRNQHWLGDGIWHQRPRHPYRYWRPQRHGCR
jgi:VCBS repeat-containing protein